ncbi:hypothetical protein [Methylorubrum zatmanii]|uniref:Uncharacterized protein n=1 Tax=Methylorubrum zatmanii TaxID=29429 RepID=A0ABW1WQR2_9HYPH|nr:hypothetical protein [Methylorubrum zatmanii]MBD8909068.1 hypothetical protein [Methylorubrum zatmanii]
MPRRSASSNWGDPQGEAYEAARPRSAQVSGFEGKLWPDEVTLLEKVPAGSKNGSFLLATNALLTLNAAASFGTISPSVQDADMSGLDISIPYQLT